MAKKNDNVNHLRREVEDNPLELIHTAMHKYRAAQYKVLKDGPHDITHMEGKVLTYIACHPGATQTDLAKNSERDKAQLARLIKRLREVGLIVGEVDAADRRSLKLSLTPEGRLVLKMLNEQSRRLAARATEGFESSERRELIVLLQRLQRNLDAPD